MDNSNGPAHNLDSNGRFYHCLHLDNNLVSCNNSNGVVFTKNIILFTFTSTLIQIVMFPHPVYCVLFQLNNKKKKKN